MTTTNDLVIACRQQGIVMTAEGEGLRVKGPDGALTEDLLRKLKEHKPEILAILAHEPGLKGSGWRPWKPESDADIAEAVKEAEDERAAIMEFDGCLPRAEVQAKAYAWHWKSDRHDPVTGSYGGTYICPHADPETVRHELEARFGGRVTELHRWDRAPRGAAGR